MTLITGEVVCTWCPSWRAETEARAVCLMPTKADRKNFIELVRKKRGDEAAGKLIDDVHRVWNHEFSKEVVNG